jgi:hypothetical protein
LLCDSTLDLGVVAVEVESDDEVRDFHEPELSERWKKTFGIIFFPSSF